MIWGDGTARREILYVEDLAIAMKYLMAADVNLDLFNVGCGYDLSIRELSEIISEVVGFKGMIIYDKLMPNGTNRKLLDSSRMYTMGWKPQVNERIGLENTYKDFLNSKFSSL